MKNPLNVKSKNNRRRRRNPKATYSINAKEKNTNTKRHFFLNDPDDTDLEWFAIDNNLKDVQFKISRISI